MKPAPFTYHAPATLAEAVTLLAELAPQDGRIIAGGQSLVPTMAFRMARPAHLIDINGIAELRRLEVADGRLRIGAGARHAWFEGERVPGALGRLLRKVVRNIAHQPIRTRGTFCGSIANADPASEWCCTTATLDGVIVAQSARGARRIAAADFYQGVMSTDLAEDEMVVEVELPLLDEATRSGFCEFSRRAGDFAIAMVLALYRIEDGRIADARIGVGGAEGAPRRIAEAEAALDGQPATPAIFEAAAQAAAAAITPFDDHNNTIAFRRSLVATLARRALEQAA